MPKPAFRLKAPPPPLEKSEQEALFRWRDVAKKTMPELQWLFAIPNGLWLPDAYAKTALQQGLTAGVCDVALLVPRGNYHGLLIELKRRNATPCCVKPSQKDFLGFQSSQGYYATWCKGWGEAMGLITDYLEGRVCRD